MLLTLTANALRSRISATRKPRGAAAGAGEMLQVTDLPRFAREELGLFGLNLSTNLLVGADLKRLDAIRDAADKASCPCLTLVETEVQAMGTTDDAVGDAAIARTQRVVQAAHRLGCSSIGVYASCKDTEDEQDFCIERLRRVLGLAERLEVNVLICPSPGLTEEPERLTDLIKKVGGFRIGTFPDFEVASKSPDPLGYLKRLTPYASAITAAAVRLKQGKGGEITHEPYDLRAYADVVRSVGYTGTIALDYRGTDDPVANLRLAKTLLESVVPTGVQGEPGEDDEELIGPDESEVAEEDSDDDGEDE
ncbi:MAG TPA: TIM barrel protein [Phycisphaerales bacterium]|jgi:sugar phosphate isomerase/epimerase|nr:TIM barrel protein [Phycisphaerales bacterium]